MTPGQPQSVSLLPIFILFVYANIDSSFGTYGVAAAFLLEVVTSDHPLIIPAIPSFFNYV
jgi:hypothetical protein